MIIVTEQHYRVHTGTADGSLVTATVQVVGWFG